MKVTIDTQLIRLSIAKKWKLSGDVRQLITTNNPNWHASILEYSSCYVLKVSDRYTHACSLVCDVDIRLFLWPSFINDFQNTLLER